MLADTLSRMLRSTPDLIETPSLTAGLAQSVMTADPRLAVPAAQSAMLAMTASAFRDTAVAGPDVPE